MEASSKNIYLYYVQLVNEIIKETQDPFYITKDVSKTSLLEMDLENPNWKEALKSEVRNKESHLYINNNVSADNVNALSIAICSQNYEALKNFLPLCPEHLSNEELFALVGKQKWSPLHLLIFPGMYLKDFTLTDETFSLSEIGIILDLLLQNGTDINYSDNSHYINQSYFLYSNQLSNVNTHAIQELLLLRGVKPLNISNEQKLSLYNTYSAMSDEQKSKTIIHPELKKLLVKEEWKHIVADYIQNTAEENDNTVVGAVLDNNNAYITGMVAFGTSIVAAGLSGYLNLDTLLEN